MEKQYNRTKISSELFLEQCQTWLHTGMLLFITIVISSCEDLLDVEQPRSQIIAEQVFNDESTAISAMRGIYIDMMNPNSAFASGTNRSISALLGLSSDELHYSAGTDALYLQFEENGLSPENTYIFGIWQGMYQAIYASNAMIEGIRNSVAISEAVKAQLTGEALFIRAFCHFYLTNLYGDVPLVITTDYRTTATQPREEMEVVYEQIINDLLEAQQLLEPEYPDSGERVRANKATATALISRVYLNIKDWEKAEAEATKLIQDSNYQLVGINDITLANNLEAIWQLHTSNTGTNSATNEGVYFNLPASFNALNNTLINAFEAGDLRLTEWIRLDNSSLYAAYKYKVSSSGGSRREYSTVLRLAEQFLIRAEARAMQDKLGLAIADLDNIRQRANLPLLTDTYPEIPKATLLDTILHERRVELFTEWGHRWLDLKRTGKAVSVLSGSKPDFNTDDELYPIPQQELNNNPVLNDQNPGY